MTAALLYALPGNQVLAERLALAIDAEMGELVIREFPDCETYVRLATDPRDRHVIVVGTLAKPNEHVLPLVFVTGAARQLGAARVGVVSPYLAYMRQDARFRSGEAITARLFANVLSASADWLITVEPHLHRITSLAEIYSIPAIAVHAAPAIGAWVSEHVSQPLIVGPDEESAEWTRAIATVAHAPSAVLNKTRLGDEEVEVTAPDLSGFAGCTPVIVDDILSTGRTTLAALECLRDGPSFRPAICIAVHALFHHGVQDLLHAAGAARVVTTNTIPDPSNCIDIVPEISAAAREQLTRA